MLGLSTAGVRFGPPTSLSVGVVIGLILLAAGLTGLLLSNRRLDAARRVAGPVPPPPYVGAPLQPGPYGGPPQPGPYGGPPQQTPYGGPGQQLPYGGPQYGGPPVRREPAAVGRARLVRGLAIAALAVGLIPLGVHFEVTGDPHLVVPEVAGGVRRVPTPPGVEEDAQRQIAKGSSLVYAAYEHPKYPGAAKSGPNSPVLVFYGLVGNNVPKDTMDRAFKALQRKGPFVAGISEYPGGDKFDDKIRCASVKGPGVVEVHCFWFDAATLGHLFTGEIAEPELAALLARMRPDLEQLR